MLLTLVGRLVSIMIDICKKQNWGRGVCVCVCVCVGGGGGGGGGEGKEEKGRMGVEENRRENGEGR